MSTLVDVRGVILISLLYRGVSLLTGIAHCACHVWLNCNGLQTFTVLFRRYLLVVRNRYGPSRNEQSSEEWHCQNQAGLLLSMVTCQVLCDLSKRAAGFAHTPRPVHSLAATRLTSKKWHTREYQCHVAPPPFLGCNILSRNASLVTSTSSVV